MTPRARIVLFAIYSGCVLCLNAGVLRAVIELAGHNDTSSHIVLVPFVSAALVYRLRRSIFSSIRTDYLSGFACVLFGAGLEWWGFHLRAFGDANSSLSVQMLALLTFWIGGFVLFFGRSVVRSARFPLLFLAFVIPIPAAVLDGATKFLKSGSADAVAGLFTLTGTPFYREGFVFNLPACAIEIADECSGIRSSIALLLTSLLAGHLFLTTGWKKALLVLAILPLAILKNAIRIVSLTLLAIHVDPRFLTGQLHHEGGVLFYLLTLALLLPVLALLRKSDLRLYGAVDPA